MSYKIKECLAMLLEGRHLVAEGLGQPRIDLEHKFPNTAKDILDFQCCFGDVSLNYVFHLSYSFFFAAMNLI